MARTRRSSRQDARPSDDADATTATVVDEPLLEQRQEAGVTESFEITHGEKLIRCERGNSFGQTALIFTHGAGGGLSAPATKDFVQGFNESAGVVSFQGTMNLKSRVKAFHEVVNHEKTTIALGGRSMGARAAVITATETDRPIKAIILVSYPLVGGKKDDIRDQILLDLPDTIDVLFVNGSKDKMCPLELLSEVRAKMTAKSWLAVVSGAGHGMDMTPKTASQIVRQKTGEFAAKWLRSRDEEKQLCSIDWNKEDDQVVVGGWMQDDFGGEVEQEPPAKKRRTGRAQ